MDFIDSVFSGKSRHGPFYKPACGIMALTERLERKTGRDTSRGLDVLTGIYGPSQGREWYQKYRILKWEKTLLFLTAGLGLSTVLAVASCTKGSENVEQLKRPASGDGSHIYELEAQVDGRRLKGISVEVAEQPLSQERCRQLLMEAREELEEFMEGAVPDVDAVSEDILLPDSLQNGLVEVSFRSSNYGLMDNSGHVSNDLVPEAGEAVQLEAELSCKEEQMLVSYALRIVPEKMDDASRLEREAARKMAEEETEEESRVFILPDEYDGKKVAWQLVRPSWGGWIAGITAVGCILLQLAFERDLLREGDKRREQLLMEYPSFLARLTLLAGTGMPIRRIFVRLAGESRKEDAPQIYQEVLKTVREMESGVTELNAYENFGQRCRLPQYKKCASLLSQNVRKGTGGLLGALNQEAENAFEERKALAKRKGEEAQTRLLLPMVMMLVVVMILVMVPACFSFGGF